EARGQDHFHRGRAARRHVVNAEAEHAKRQRLCSRHAPRDEPWTRLAERGGYIRRGVHTECPYIAQPMPAAVENDHFAVGRGPHVGHGGLESIRDTVVIAIKEIRNDRRRIRRGGRYSWRGGRRRPQTLWVAGICWRRLRGRRGLAAWWRLARGSLSRQRAHR